MLRLKSLWLLLPLYVGVPIYQTYAYLAALPFYDTAEAINYAGGIALFYWLLGSILLSQKIPLLQGLFAHDERIRWHVVTNLGILALYAYHTAYKMITNQFLDLVSWLLLFVYSAVVLKSLGWVHIRGWGALHKPWAWLRDKLGGASYEVGKKLHTLLNLGLVVLMYIHLTLTELRYLIEPLSLMLWDALFWSTSGLWLVSRFRLLLLPRARVLSATRQADILSLECSLPSGFKSRAGQFAWLKVEVPGLMWEEHPFSFLGEPPSSGGQKLHFAIRDLGDYTKRLADLACGPAKLRPNGMKVRINGGFGNFRPLRSHHPSIFIGTGIGIVPILSHLGALSGMLAEFETEGSDPKGSPQRDRAVHMAAKRFIFGLDAPDQIPLPWTQTAIESVCAGRPDTMAHFVYRGVDGGIIDSALLEAVAGSIQASSLHDIQWLICSSPQVRDTITRDLLRMGVKRRALLFESFSW